MELFVSSDPRPDLPADSKVWQAVFQEAWVEEFPYLWSLLRAMRCYGCRLRWVRGSLKLDWERYEEDPKETATQKEERLKRIRENLLVPNKEWLAEVFKAVKERPDRKDLDGLRGSR